ncbi:MAG TPA: glycosyl hydrolase family 57, partial [Actinomycetes bacterium]|nr:glycosyl hydrolase family 57 [Actinomycetes bacterium]
MHELPEYGDGLPNLCGSEALIEGAVAAGRERPVFLGETPARLAEVDSAFAVALHMHQPLIPAGGAELHTATIVSNLQWMLEHPDIGDNHNAAAFRWCYQRMGELVPQLLAEGFEPRVMLEYSGTLLEGLRRMGAGEVLDTLERLTRDPSVRHAVEWLG